MRRILGSIAVCALFSGCSQGASLNPQDSGASVPLAVTHQTAVPEQPVNPKVRFFATPTELSWPDYITKGSDGNLWFSEFYADQVGRITPAGVITEFPLPQLNDIEGIATGPDGNVWFTEPGENKVGKITTTGDVTAFPVASNSSPRGIAAGPDGNVWFVEFNGNAIGRITPDGAIKEFAIPQAESYPWWITTGKDGDLWFTESATDDIVRFNPRTLKFAKPLHVPGNFVTPWGIMTAPDGHLWFTQRHSGDLSVVLGGKVKSFHIAKHTSYPDTIVTGPDGMLWFTENQTNAIGRLDPATGTFRKSILLPVGDIPTGIAVGSDNNIWFTVANYYQPNSIGEIVLH